MFHSNEYDDLAGGYPFPGKDDIVHWTAFNSDIQSSEFKGKEILADCLENHKDERVDLRPYILENPLTITIYTKFERVLDLFRTQHMRHLLVRYPSNGDLAGIITRQDVFAYMHL